MNAAIDCISVRSDASKGDVIASGRSLFTGTCLSLFSDFHTKVLSASTFKIIQALSDSFRAHYMYKHYVLNLRNEDA